MPRSSISLIRDASVKRGGGWVKCCSALTSQQTSRSPGSRAGIWPSRSRSSSRFQIRWKPSKASTDPVARKMKSEAAMVTRVLRKRAGAIWLATNRRQISSYSRACSGGSSLTTCSGVRVTSVGRIASWASWMF